MTVQKTAKQPIWMTRDTMAVDEGQTLKSTMNYDKFRIDLSNRQLDERHVNELVEAIRKKNLLREYPIVVSTDYTVIDGQNRLAAARILKVPIYFIVSSETTIEDVAETNMMQKKWVQEDYLHHWSASGSPHYIALQEFRKTYPFLSVSISRFLLSGHLQRSDGTFDSGNFQITRPELADKVARCLLDFSKYTPLYMRFQFINAVTSMVANPAYNHKRMLQKLDYMSGHLHRCVDANEYLSMLSDIYNFKVKEEDKVKFVSLTNKKKPKVVKG